MTVQCPAFELPASNFLDEATQAALAAQRARLKALAEEAATADLPQPASPAEARELEREQFYNSETYQNLLKRYSVEIETTVIGGIDVEIFTPSDGIAPNNHSRVLLNFHGGAFQYGSRTNSHLESIPIAALGKIKVISVDYRMAPEHQFPAASIDIVAVYKALLADYAPDSIGLYGCSAGGMLAAEAIAFFRQEQLPLPGAIGMFCGAAYGTSEGDSMHFVQAITDYAITTLATSAYFKGVAPENPLAFPGYCPDTLAAFPPSLLISASRDFAMSSVIHTHSQLTRLGVEADLHLWDGLEHAFIYNADLQAARDSYDIIVQFFQKHLSQTTLCSST